MAGRYELSDEQRSEIAGLIPVQRGRGERFRDHRSVADGMFWKLCSGAPWRDLPERYGPWQTVCSRFRRWSREGLFEEILRRLRLRLAEDGSPDLDAWHADSTGVRAHKAAAGAKKGAGTRPSGGAGAASARRPASSATGTGTRSPRS
ncbi:hypothetical protein BH11ARM2_BH11ARM2_26410 [soil metagenome]